MYYIRVFFKSDSVLVFFGDVEIRKFLRQGSTILLIEEGHLESNEIDNVTSKPLHMGICICVM